MPELTSHTIAIGLAIAVVISLAAMLNVVREQTQSSIAQATAEHICAQIKLSAEQLEPTSQPSTILLELPDKLGGEPYSVRASGHSITVSSVTANHSCIAGVQPQLSGMAFGALRLMLSENQIVLSGV